MMPVWVLPVMPARPMPLRMLSTRKVDSSTPEHRARAAEDAHPAQQHHRDDVQLESLAVLARTAPSRAAKHARERRDEPLMVKMASFARATRARPRTAPPSRCCR